MNTKVKRHSFTGLLKVLIDKAETGSNRRYRLHHGKSHFRIQPTGNQIR